LASAPRATTLVVSSVGITPGNPCNLNGNGGGVAVKEAGAAGRFYYGVMETKNIPPPTRS